MYLFDNSQIDAPCKPSTTAAPAHEGLPFFKLRYSMKNLILTLLFILIQIANAQAQGIQFFKGSFAEALKEAERTNRYVFVDVYTTWCGPCKMMDREVFSDPRVGELMNTFFVNFKADAEGSGKNVAGKYSIRAYPTLLFVTPSGNEIDRQQGSRPKELFMSIAENVVNRTTYGTIYRQCEQVWKEGNRSPEFVTEYLKLRAHYGLSNAEPLRDFLQNVPTDSLEMPQVEKVAVLGTNETCGAGFEYLLARKSSRRCALKLSALLSQLANRAVADKDQKAFDEYLQLAEKVENSTWEAELRKGDFQARYFLETKQKDEYQAFAQRFVQVSLLPYLSAEVLSADSLRFTRHRQALENIGWQYSEFVKDKAALQSAYDWLEQANQVQASSAALGYQAMLADKFGDDRLRCQKLKAAIQTAKARNEPAEEWEKVQKRCK